VSVLGVELTADTARAVLETGGSGRVVEVPFDSARPELAVATLREAYGRVGAVALAVGYAHLYVTAPRLPPVAPAQRVAILALEPDRFFPVSGPAAVALAGDTAFAADAAAVERWVAAFSAWTRVAAVHAAPVAIAHAVDEEGTFVVPDEMDGETAVVVLARGTRTGALAGARRVPAGVAVDAPPLPPPARGLPPRLAAAVGAARWADAAPHDQLLTPTLAARARAERTRRTATAAAACAAALLFALWGADQARERTLARTEAAVARAADSARTARDLFGRLTALDRGLAAAQGAGRSALDPLAVLAALSARLPRDATVLNLTAAGDEWRIEGRAANAAAVVPALDRDPHLSDVHLAGPTTRFTEGRRAYESFSVAFRVVP
jgi:hypothetical protein